MLKGGRLLIVLVVASGAYADVSVPAQSFVPGSTSAVVSPSLTLPVLSSSEATLDAEGPRSPDQARCNELGLDWRVCDEMGRPVLPVGAWSTTLSECPFAGPPSAVLDLPPLPSSTSLFLSAALTLGAFQLARSARQVHLGALPHWYHEHCPARIGHAVAFDMQFGPLAVCPFSGLDGELPAFTRRVLREHRSRFNSQSILLIESPRGPPGSA